MVLNLIFTKLNLKKRVKTAEQYQKEQISADIFEQTKRKYVEVVMRQLY
ncbi:MULTISPECIES: hypothetical protein [Heyndrickxia]|nr:hypothetical protein [Heyndrickxia shackletonii]MBB2481755.1 hypothetical protein [Bacillus sp. APMAM]NEY99539.1 hypothetical protein [Heyndrickxia shackletonii]